MMAMTMHATNVLRDTGAVVSAEDYRAVCVERDRAVAEVRRLTALVKDRTPEIVTSGDLTIDLMTGALSRQGSVFGHLTTVERAVIRRLAQQQGQPVSFAALDTVVWDSPPSNDGHRARVNLSRIRSKLGDGIGKSGRGLASSKYFITYPEVGVALR